MHMPDRWLDYSFHGKQIANTPFVALKCPLHEDFFLKYPREKHFTPRDVKALLPRVSLIIDLTNTRRYYDPNAFSELGIKHIKIPVEGHVTPRTDVIKKFFFFVDEFLSNTTQSDDGLIGVHCTHGVNRTGFLICSYMISKLNFTYASAVEEFNRARGHNLERENYLQELQKYEKTPLCFVYDKNEFSVDSIPTYNSRFRPVKSRHRSFKNRHESYNGQSRSFVASTFNHRERSTGFPAYVNQYCPNFGPAASDARLFRSPTYYQNRDHTNDLRYLLSPRGRNFYSVPPHHRAFPRSRFPSRRPPMSFRRD